MAAPSSLIKRLLPRIFLRSYKISFEASKALPHYVNLATDILLVFTCGHAGHILVIVVLLVLVVVGTKPEYLDFLLLGGAMSTLSFCGAIWCLFMHFKI